MVWESIGLEQAGFAGAFVLYLIYQAKLLRDERKEERELRIKEKNQFIQALGEITKEMRSLSELIKKLSR